jgi:hypothetical protein
MDMFDVKNLTGDQYVEVTFRGYVTAVSPEYVTISSIRENDYDFDYDEIGIGSDYWSHATFTPLPTPFPDKVGTVIVHDDTSVLLVRNVAGDWIDLESNVIYAESDLGPFEDYSLQENDK